jgi:hypothetical protein
MHGGSAARRAPFWTDHERSDLGIADMLPFSESASIRWV